ncbi:MAG: tRNA dihydrouridine synthase DusB [Gemmatimonadota bacterium]
MIAIGPLLLERPLLLAPMEDVSDLPFRVMCRRLGADVVYTEFISSEGLIRDARICREKLRLDGEEHPVGIQIFGASVEVMVQAARIAEEVGPDLIDINIGCPVKSVACSGAGAGLLRDPALMEAIVAGIIEAVDLPVTVKTRLGWDADSIRIIENAQLFERLGAHALAIHARTRVQQRKGQADWAWIRRTRDAIGIPVFGNGDVRTPEDALRMEEQTGADGIMIGRAAVANPWIFLQTKAYRETGVIPAIAPGAQFGAAFEHFALSLEHKGPRRGVIEFRKHWKGYLRDLPLSGAVRSEMMQFTEAAPVEDRLLAYSAELGVAPDGPRGNHPYAAGAASAAA